MTDVSADDDGSRARARALSSPLRLRILRFCLHEAHTNREIADEFALNPGTSLHHVRTLLDTGFLRAEPSRRGRRGATEVPYLATRRSWDADVPGVGPILVQTFLDEIADVPAEELMIGRLGLKLNAEHERELLSRLFGVLAEYKELPADEDGRPLSVMIAAHPEHRRTP
jgi:DNA-binding transcriptional ArsR family regulator